MIKVLVCSGDRNTSVLACLDSQSDRADCVRMCNFTETFMIGS